MANSPAFAGTGVAVSLPAEPTFVRTGTQDTLDQCSGASRSTRARQPSPFGSSNLREPVVEASQHFAMVANDLRQICVRSASAYVRQR